MAVKLALDVTCKRFHAALPETLYFKVSKHYVNTHSICYLQVSLDGRNIAGSQVMIGITPINTGAPLHSPEYVFPLAIAKVKETRQNIEKMVPDLVEYINHSQTTGIEYDGLQRKLVWYLSGDLCTLRKVQLLWCEKSLTNVKVLGNDPTCCYCLEDGSSLDDISSEHELHEFYHYPNTLFPDIPPERIIFCTLHGLLYHRVEYCD